MCQDGCNGFLGPVGPPSIPILFLTVLLVIVACLEGGALSLPVLGIGINAVLHITLASMAANVDEFVKVD